MQAGITFSENALGAKAADHRPIFHIAKPIQELQQIIEEGDWDERLPYYEKYINRFSWGVIIASVIFLAPVCINIFTR